MLRDAGPLIAFRKRSIRRLFIEHIAACFLGGDGKMPSQWAKPRHLVARTF
jgi:hypothetical protein